MSTCDIGMIGLGVMGRNLATNIANHGYRVAGFDIDAEKSDAFTRISEQAFGYRDLGEFTAALKPPRRVMMMLPAGPVVDKVVHNLSSFLAPDDVLIDGGNSHFKDTNRRVRELEERGLLFVGMGVSGGEEGALHGPSLMPGGSATAWPLVQPIFQDIAAKVEDGTPCCAWIGPEGAGHFVKMVHNGIEYGDMQMICEAYFLLKQVLGMSADELQHVFFEWNKGELNSYLIEITARIFGVKDPGTGQPVVDGILDTAGQKGTGKWTSMVALDLGIGTPTIAEAVFARCVSAIKEERTAAALKLKGPRKQFTGDRDKFVEEVRRALYASKICSYAQGFALLKAASDEFGWNLKLGDIALLWREGCIIRAQFLGHIKNAFSKRRNVANLLLDPFFRKAIRQAQPAWRRVVVKATQFGVPVPAFGSALAYYDGYRAEHLPANLLQAQRDFFGAHTYERIDQPRGTFFHTDWSGTTT